MRSLLPVTVWGWLAITGVATAVLGLVFAQPSIRPRREITLTAQAVPLSSGEASVDRLGALKFLGGLALRSTDNAFGGLSGLLVEARADGLWLIAITDQGDRMTGRILGDGDRMTGIDQATIEPLLNLEGAPIAGKAFGDAESMTRLANGRVLVGFERQHRIWSYAAGLTGRASVLETPSALAEAPSNGGIESLASWPDGRVLAITERMETDAANLAAFLYRDGTWARLEWKASGAGFNPSDATVSPGGDLLVLERFWSRLAPASLRARILRVKGDLVRGGAVLEGELVAEFATPNVTENFEGIAAFRTATGATQLLVVSDDNFNSAQRTLLLRFEIP
jgi:hypothetical protein